MKFGPAPSSINIGNTGICFGCTFLMFQCSLFVMLVNDSIEVCYVVTLESRGNRNGTPPPLVKSCGPFVKKTSSFSHLACVFVEFVSNRRTQLLHHGGGGGDSAGPRTPTTPAPPPPQGPPANI